MAGCGSAAPVRPNREEVNARSSFTACKLSPWGVAVLSCWMQEDAESAPVSVSVCRSGLQSLIEVEGCLLYSMSTPLSYFCKCDEAAHSSVTSLTVFFQISTSIKSKTNFLLQKQQKVGKPIIISVNRIHHLCNSSPPRWKRRKWSAGRPNVRQHLGKVLQCLLITHCLLRLPLRTLRSWWQCCLGDCCDKLLHCHKTYFCQVLHTFFLH